MKRPTFKHESGASNGDILFDTPFNYLFEYLCRQKDCKLPKQQRTVRGLLKLGEIMGKPGDEITENLDSSIPALYTYFGQFIDHDLTARTDREEGISEIAGPDGNAREIEPLDPQVVIDKIKNGRRPQLDLDSLFGDGPSFAENVSEQYRYKTISDHLYDKRDLKLFVKYDKNTGYLDINRDKDGHQLLADERNAENLLISQLHAVFKLFYNGVIDYLRSEEPQLEREYRYAKARQLTRWAYQFVVVEDYLKRVCMPEIVTSTLLNGAKYFQPGRRLFMPLEFSVAAFRFGHSMIRPEYILNDSRTEEINKLLGMGDHIKNGRLLDDRVLDFEKFISINGSDPQKARLIDPLISKGLFNLKQLGPQMGTMLARLTQRNLLRGYLLSLPTGQSIAHAIGIHPMESEELLQGFNEDNQSSIKEFNFDEKSPLWFYVLQEAKVHTGGNSLGAVGSTLVAETILGLLQNDPNSYLSKCCDAEISTDPSGKKGIKIGQQIIATLSDIVQIGLGLKSL